MNWVMSAGVAPLVCRAPFAFRVVGRTDSTNLRMHWLDRIIVDSEVRFDRQGDYSQIESAPSVGPCFGSTISVREFGITPLPPLPGVTRLA
jgi:hypothetical protein